MLKRLYNFFLSRTLAIYLYLSVLFLLLLAAVLPDPRYIPPEKLHNLQEDLRFVYNLIKRFNLKTITESIFFYLIVIFLSINTFICTLQRVVTWLRTSSDSRIPWEHKGVFDFTYKPEIVPLSELTEDLKKQFRGLWRYRFHQQNDGTSLFYFKRGLVGFWGSIIFHICLLMVLFGAVYNSLTGISSSIPITEGEVVYLKDYQDKESSSLRTLPDLQLRLDDFYYIYKDKKFPVEFSVILTVKSNEKEEQEKVFISVNKPYINSGAKFMLQLYGFTPYFTIKNSRGDILFNSYVNLDVAGEKNFDTFDIPEEDMTIVAYFYPDLIIKDGKPFTLSRVPDNPAFLIQLKRGNEIIGEKIVKLTDEVNINDYFISFRDLREWITIRISRQVGLFFIFLSLFVGSIGVAIRAVDPEENIWIYIKGNDIKIYFLSNWYPEMLRERIKKIMELY